MSIWRFFQPNFDSKEPFSSVIVVADPEFVMSALIFVFRVVPVTAHAAFDKVLLKNFSIRNKLFYYSYLQVSYSHRLSLPVLRKELGNYI